MKQFAAHYLFLPNVGFLKQGVVQLSSTGIVEQISVLTNEVEALEWHAGTIVLVASSTFLSSSQEMVMRIKEQMNGCSATIPYDKAANRVDLTISYIALLLYPFDFKSMQPVDETQHRQLL